MTQANSLLAAYATRRDAEAFAQIVEQYQQLVLATCRRRLRNPADVDDAVQETFLRLAQKAGELHTNIGAWLHTCACNVAIDIQRRYRTRQRHEAGAALQPEPVDDDSQRMLAELREHLDVALAKLDPEQRELIIQRFFVGRPQVELAAEAGVVPSAIAQRLDRAIERLRRHLKTTGCVTIAIGGMAVVASLLQQEAASAAVPPALTVNIMKIGLSGIPKLGGSAAGLGLSRRLLFTTKIKLLIGAAALFLVALGLWLVQTMHLPPAARDSAHAMGSTPTPNGITINSNVNASVAKPPQWMSVATAPARSPAVLAGRVTDRNGNPVPNATVSLDGPYTSQAVSDAQGLYSFPTVRAGGQYRVSVRAHGYAMVANTSANQDPSLQLSPQSQAFRDFIVERGLSIVATTTDENGQAIPGAAVDANVRDDEHFRYSLPRQLTDSAGQTELTLPLSNKSYVISATIDGRAPAHAQVTPDSLDRATEVRLVLEPGFTVRGVAVCSDGKPAAGWTVSARPDWWASNYYPGFAKVDADGNFTLKDIAPGTHDVWILTNHSAESVATVRLPPTSQPLQLRIPHSSPASRVKFAGRVQFIVSSGKAANYSSKLDPVTVQATALTGEHEVFFTRLQTGRVDGKRLSRNEGQFAFEGLPPGRYQLTFRSTDIDERTLEDVDVSAQLPPVELHVVSKPHVTGTVTDAANGHPLTQFAVRVCKIRPLGTGPDYPQDARWVQVSNPQGRFNVEVVGPGLYQVQASAGGYAWQWSAPTRVQRNGMIIDIPFALTAGGTLTGVVVSPAGAPVSKAKVIPLSMAGGAPYGRRVRFDSDAGAVATDENGRFVIEHLSVGEDTIKVVHPDFAPLTVEHQQITESVKREASPLQLRIGGNVAGTVFDSDGKPLADERLQFQDDRGVGLPGEGAAGSIASVVTDELGHYRVEHLDEQVLFVSRPKAAWQKGILRRVVRPLDGKTTQLDFGGANPLTGRLVSQGQPIAARRINLAVASPSVSPLLITAMTDAAGRFAFYGAPSGHYALFFESPFERGAWIPLRTVDVAADNQQSELGDVIVDVGDVVINLVGEESALKNVAYVSIAASAEPGAGQDSLGSVEEERSSSWRAHAVPAGSFSVKVAMKGKVQLTYMKQFNRAAAVPETAVCFSLPSASAKLTLDVGEPTDANKDLPVDVLLANVNRTVNIRVPTDSFSPTTIMELPLGVYGFVDPIAGVIREDIAPVELADGEPRKVIIPKAQDSLASASVVRVAIWRPDGVLAAGALPRLIDAAGKTFNVTNTDGLFSLFVVGPGRYRLMLDDSASRAFRRSDIDIPSSGAQERDSDRPPMNIVLH